MKKIACLLVILFISIKLNAQWEKVATYNVGATGMMTTHGSTVFLYGYQGEQFVYRSVDNGTSWTNIANKFPDKVYYVHGHGDYVFAIVGVNKVYTSSDDGVTWSLRSSINYSAGAALSLVSDGTILYGVSNRNTVFKSTDNGSTWTQIDINYSQAQVLGLDFAAVGNTMVFCANQLGAFISSDGGKNWTLKNPAIVLGTVQAHNSEIYGTTYGMYKLGNNEWTSIISGLPNGVGVSGSTKSAISIGNKIYVYYSDVITQASKIFVSSDNGKSWVEAGANLPTAQTSSLNNFIAASSGYLYYYVYSIFSPTTTGVYRLPIQTSTSVKKDLGEIPTNISLNQNYPNPFNPSTKISFSIPQQSEVSLKVYNVLGAEVANLVQGNYQAGSYNVDFNASNLASGIYIYTLNTNSFSQSRKMILAK